MRFQATAGGGAGRRECEGSPAPGGKSRTDSVRPSRVRVEVSRRADHALFDENRGHKLTGRFVSSEQGTRLRGLLQEGAEGFQENGCESGKMSCHPGRNVLSRMNGGDWNLTGLGQSLVRSLVGGVSGGAALRLLLEGGAHVARRAGPSQKQPPPQQSAPFWPLLPVSGSCEQDPSPTPRSPSLQPGGQ